jgi:hypothetical protein
MRDFTCLWKDLGMGQNMSKPMILMWLGNNNHPQIQQSFQGKKGVRIFADS